MDCGWLRIRLASAFAVSGLLTLLFSSSLYAGVSTNGALFTQSVRPILQEYCITCHSTAKQKGELDLERFTSVAAVKKESKVWQAVIEQITNNEMPPKDKPQLGRAQREQLLVWANSMLDEIALARAGDPGPVVLRRLSNAEYTYTLRDLTGVGSLDPAREFPVDGASGEGFMNVGNSLVMSPSLVTKYLDAGKGIARHAMLVPDGIRFSPHTTRRDWTEEILAEIRDFYSRYTERGGGTAVNLQGIKFDTKDGGVLPLEKYIAAAIEVRDHALPAEWLRTKAREGGLSSNYLETLWKTLNASNAPLLLTPLRARWRSANAGDAASIARDITLWQQSLWKFNSVGHIGKAGGPKGWLESFSPLVATQELRVKIPAPADGQDVTLYITASDAGDGNEGDFVVFQRPRLVAPGRPDLLLRDVQAVTQRLAERRQKIFAETVRALEAASEAETSLHPVDAAQLAEKYGVSRETISAWLDYLGIGSGGGTVVTSLFTNKLDRSSSYDFIKGWGSPETPSLMANSSDQHVRIPGNMKPRSVAVHPSPKLSAVVGWRSPVAAKISVDAAIQHAHPECGNGVTWTVDVRRDGTRQRLGAGIAHGGTEVRSPHLDIYVRPGDVVSLAIGPRDGNHACDLTAVDLTLGVIGNAAREWNLSADVSPNILAGNPHSDRFGNSNVWHFYTEPAQAAAGPIIPPGSLLAKWQAITNADEKRELSVRAQQLLSAEKAPAKDSPDGALYRQLTAANGPLLKHWWLNAAKNTEPAAGDFGIDPARFGRYPNGTAMEAASLCVRAPEVLEVRLPADLADGCELVSTAALDAQMGREGSVQLQVGSSRPREAEGLMPAGVTSREGEGPWYSNNKQVVHNTPIIVSEGSRARQRIEAEFDTFRRVFPAALCYMKIVPVDEVVTLTLFHREDDHFKRLMLDDKQAKELDRLWEQLRYVSQDALTLVDVFEQLWQYATQDADPNVFEPMREPIKQRAAKFRQWLLDSEPKHLDAVLVFAEDAYRRPLTDGERFELRGLYKKLREQEISHAEAVRLTLARVLVAPAFLYRIEKPAPGTTSAPVNDWELANRLSYFLWSSAPDEELKAAAARGELNDPTRLVMHAGRMLADARVRRLATEFGCAWLHIYAFDELEDKSERHFPAFNDLRGAMYEESIRYLTDLFQNGRPVLNLLNSDYTFLNERLAKHYGIPGVTGTNWQRVEGIGKFARGGILGQASTLAKQSGASRTSPILRGNWISEVLLGEKLPRPPKDVPQLPQDEATETLTVRQLTERHTADPRCAGCHARIDGFGFALEGFDAIGRRRERDLGGRPVDIRGKSPDGREFADIQGLRNYLLSMRGEAFLNQFCRKLLGYALAREVQLSDRPLLVEMREQLQANEYRVSAAIETIVRSRQFREIRGRDHAAEDFASSSTHN